MFKNENIRRLKSEVPYQTTVKWGNRRMTIAGLYNPNTDTITINKLGKEDPSFYESILAHEIGHAKWQRIWDSYQPDKDCLPVIHEAAAMVYQASWVGYSTVFCRYIAMGRIYCNAAVLMSKFQDARLPWTLESFYHWYTKQKIPRVVRELTYG